LKSRSAAIRTALTKYNEAAADLFPPRSPLSWEEIVEYAFLADFDLLRDTREDIRQRPWATPAARLAMDSYFKLLRAEEEILRLNVEVRRFATFIRDENQYLHTMEQQNHSQQTLAFQIRMKRMEMGRYDALHMKIINQITKLAGYTGGELYGTHIPINISLLAKPPVTQQEPLISAVGMHVDDVIDGDEDLEDEQTGEDQDEAVLGAYYSVIEFSYDRATAQL
jgi:hypothetical protein